MTDREEHLEAIYEEVERAMARSRLRETMKEAGIQGDKADCME